MVRLKAAGLRGLGRRSAFQFQYGTIKRGTAAPAVVPDFIFQFQYGTIKR